MAEKEYIEREALINACKKIIHDRWNETTAPVSWSHAYADFIDDINEQPTADVAPVRHGCFRMLTFSGDTIICSECKMAYNIFETNGAENFNFCPHCGTKMDKLNKCNS